MFLVLVSALGSAVGIGAAAAAARVDFKPYTSTTGMLQCQLERHRATCACKRPATMALGTFVSDSLCGCGRRVF